MRPTLRRLVFCFAACLVLLAACGDDSAAPPAADADPEPADEPEASLVTESTEPPAPSDDATPCDAEPIVRTTADGVDFVRTPDACFEDLPDWPYEPHDAEIDGLRQAYVDEGPAHGAVVLLLHGQPSWSYLYRHMIPVLADAGYRVIAMDHLGMGRSDKPTDLDSYSYLGHNDRLVSFIDELALSDINLFVQDWGSLIGLRVAGLNPDSFATIAVGDGMLPVIPEGVVPFPPVENPDELADIASIFTAFPEQQVPFYDGCELLVGGGSGGGAGNFAEWIVYSMTAESFHASEVVEALTWFDLTPEEEAAYDAPFPSRIYMGGPRTFPSLVNQLPGQTAEAWEGLTAFDKPFLTIWAGNDPGNLGRCATQQTLIDSVPGAEGQPHDRLAEASHFLQDDQGTEIATRLADWYADLAANSAGRGDRIGFELLERMDDGTIRAWISTDPMTVGEFEAIELPDNWFKNQPREGSVGGGRFLGSPGADGVTVYEDHFGYTWFHSATVVQVGVPVDDEGILRGAIVEKAHEISYDPGSTVIALVSPAGDTYVRIGRDAGRTSDDPTLPTGWEIVGIEVPDGYTTLLPDGTLVIRTDNEDSFQGPVTGL